MSDDAAKIVTLKPPRPCPICGQRSQQKFHPFCSKHCADVDLNRWLKGTYAIPAVEPPDEWDEASQSRPPEDDGER